MPEEWRDPALVAAAAAEAEEAGTSGRASASEQWLAVADAFKLLERVLIGILVLGALVSVAIIVFNLSDPSAVVPEYTLRNK
mmetsp:Transcript_66561/g.188885  ORF Transcript_66561/g.188885 Transcript_66561/m.188885 type:complete len:82 (-) Transcript_66561:61-306(-)